MSMELLSPGSMIKHMQGQYDTIRINNLIL